MASITANSTATPSLASPPFIPIPGLPNFRDAGGYPIASKPGKMVRRGVLFRAAEPGRATDEGIARLQSLGIAIAYDLRSEKEIAGQSSGVKSGAVREWDGCERHFVPVFLVDDYSPEAIAKRYKNFSATGTEGFVRAYARILELGADPSHPYRPFSTILAHLASTSPSPPAPILVHCTAGKDRTGVICAVVLSLCGVSDEVVAHEYSLTDAGLGARKQEFIDHLVESPALRGDRAGAERMVSSRKENMLATLAMVRETYGSVEQYVTAQCGLSAAQVEQLRRNLVVDVDAQAEKGSLVDWETHAKMMDGLA